MNFKQINEIDMIMKELRNIDDMKIDKTESHFMVYIIIAITAVTISAIIFRKEIVSKIASNVSRWGSYEANKLLPQQKSKVTAAED